LTTPYGAVYGESFPVPTVGTGVCPSTLCPFAAQTYALNINPQIPAGVYNIEVMALDSNGIPAPASGTDAGASWAIVGQVVVQSP
jgi:hypothetical protein